MLHQEEDLFNEYQCWPAISSKFKFFDARCLSVTLLFSRFKKKKRLIRWAAHQSSHKLAVVTNATAVGWIAAVAPEVTVCSLLALRSVFFHSVFYRREAFCMLIMRLGFQTPPGAPCVFGGAALGTPPLPQCNSVFGVQQITARWW